MDLFRMIGVLGWTWRDVAPLTLRDVVVAHDAALVNQWDQTATTATLLHGLIATTANMWGKGRKVKPKGFFDFHPYRQKKPRGIRITSERIGVLREIGDALFAKTPKRR